VVLANNFILVAAPSGSLSTFALFAADARLRKLPASSVVLGVGLFAIAESAALSVFALAGLILGSSRRTLIVTLPPAVVMLALTAAYIAGLALGMRARPRLENWAAAAARRLNPITRRLFGREAAPEAAIHQLADDMAGDLARLGRQPLPLWFSAACTALLAKAGLMALLALCGLAFGQRLSVPALVAGAAMAAALTIVSPTPQGVGIVEGALAYLLTASGVPAEPAVLISLLYRGFTLWLPMIYGFAALQAGGLRAVLDAPSGKPG
jgi:uncharacterized membrane protein YbhN (UPF0104 family)